VGIEFDFAAMPGFVSVQNPPQTPPLPVFIPEDPTRRNEHSNGGNANKTPSGRSPSNSRVPSKKAPEKAPTDQSSLENPDLGPFLLKVARDTMTSGENPNKALDYALRASKSFEKSSGPGLELVVSLQVVAAIYCSLRQFEEAVSVLERSIEVPDPENGSDHALAKFSGYMQLGDTYSVLGKLDKSISCYGSALKIQIEVLGGSDPRVAETCR
jgi:tetratricopeptide (TPR) repeat protein